MQTVLFSNDSIMKICFYMIGLRKWILLTKYMFLGNRKFDTTVWSHERYMQESALAYG